MGDVTEGTCRICGNPGSGQPFGAWVADTFTNWSNLFPGEIICKSGLVRISPLAWWTTEDVAAYTVVNGLPVLQTYQRLGFEARTTSRVPRASYAIRESMLANLRRSDPNRYNQLCRLLPEVSEYA